MGRKFDGGTIVTKTFADMSGAIDSIKELEGVIKQLSKATSGVNFASVWGNVETVLGRAKSAMQDFQRAEGRINAENVVKLTNALQAIDPDLYTKTFGNMMDQIARAKELAPTVAQLFNTADLSEAFSVFEKIANAGGDVSSLFGKLSENSSQSAIRVRELEQETAQLRSTLISTQEELAGWKAGEGVQNLQAQLDAADTRAQSLQETLIETRDMAASEFSTWLQANNLDFSSWGQFSHLFDAIKEGSITANDAITDVKSNYGYLLEEFAQTNGALPSGAFDTLTSKLDEISAKMAELGSGGAGTNAVRELASGLSESANITEQERVALAGLAQTANGDLQSVVQVIEALFSSIQQVGEGTNTATTSVSSFISELRQLSGEGVESLSALSDMFTSLARNRDLSVGSLKGLTDFVAAIGGNEFAHIGNLTQLSGVDLRKFSELKVSKAALSNLATFLPTISEVNVESLQSLANITWDNLNNVKVDKSSISAIADMANMNESLGRMEEAFTGLGNQLSEITAKFNEMKEAASSGPKDTFGRAFNVKSATTEVNKLASDIESLKVKMSDLGSSGANMERMSQYIAAAEGHIKSFRDNLNETGGVINKDLGKSSLDGLREAMANANAEAAKMKETVSVIDSVGKQLSDIQSKSTNQTVLGNPEAFTEYKSKLEAASAAYQEFKDKIATQKLELGSEQGVAELQKVKDAIKEAEEAYNKSVETMNQKKVDAKNIADGAKEAAKAEKELEQATKDATKAFVDMQKAQALDQKITNILSQSTEGVNQFRSELERVQRELQTAIQVGNREQLADVYKRASAEVSNLQQKIQGVKAESASLGSVLNGLLGNTLIGSIGKMAMGRGVMYLRRVAREFVQSAVEIESSLAQLQVVTGASGGQLEQFFGAASESAKGLGVEVKDMLGSVETFSRLGYSLNESVDLSKWATILGNIADMDVSAATTGITSILKGWGKDVSEAEHIADVISIIGKNYAISSEEIVTASEKSGAALMAAGTSMEKSMALFAAANASVQNANVVGTALKTVSARITKSTSDLEELGEDYSDLAEGMSKYREEIQAMSGVDIMIDDNTYKDVYDIFKELSQVWDQLSQTQQARISEILGGTRGLTVISSIMQNFGDAEAALADAMGSAGVAAKANDVIMDTTQKKVEQLKTSFQVLAHNVLASDLTKSIVDFGTKFIEIIDAIATKFGGLPTLLGGFFIVDFIKNITNLSTAAKVLSGSLPGNASELKGWAAAANSMSSAASTLGISISSLLGILGGVAAVVAAVGIGVKLYGDHLEEMRGAADAASEANRNMASDIDTQLETIGSLKAKLEDENTTIGEAATIRGQLLDIQQSLVEQYGLEAGALDVLGDSLDTTNEKLQKELGLRALRSLDENAQAYEEAASRIRDAGEELGIGDPGNTTSLKYLMDYSDAYKDLFNGLADAYDNVSITDDEFGFLTITGDAYEVQTALDGIYNAMLQFEQTNPIEADNIANWDSIKGNIRANLDSVGSIIDEFGERYNDYMWQQILADTDSRKFYKENVNDHIEALQDAIANGHWHDAKAEIDWLNALSLDSLPEDVREYVAKVIQDAINAAPDEARAGAAIKGESYWEKYYGGATEAAEEAATKAKKSFDSVWTDSEGKDTDFSKSIDQYISDTSKLQDALKKIKSGTLSDSDMFSLFKEFPQLAANADDLGTAISDMLDQMDADMAADFEAQLASLGDETDQAKLQAIADTILAIGNASESTTQYIADETEKLNLLETAMKESASEIGVSADSIHALQARYRDLDGYDPAKLFERTANGIHLNTDALDELEAAYIRTEKSSNQSKLQSLQDQYAELSRQINMCTDASERANLYTQRDGVLAEIQDCQNRIAMYDALTSAYNRWKTAQSAGNESDMYRDIAGNLEAVQESIDQGWVTNDIRQFVDLLSFKNLSTASVSDVVSEWERLHETIAGTDYSAMDFFRWDDDKKLTTEGLENFLSACQQIDDTMVNWDGKEWHIDFGLGKDAEMAEQLGIDVEMLQTLLRALADAGDFDISLDSFVDNIELAQTFAERAVGRLNELYGTDRQIDFGSTNIDQVTSDLELADSIIDDLTKNRGLSLDSQEVKDAQMVAIALSRQLNELEKPAILKMDTSEATDAFKALSDSWDLIGDYEIAIKYGVGDPGDIEAQILEKISTIQAIADENGIELEVDADATPVEQLQSVLGQLGDVEPSVLAEVFGIKDVQDLSAAEDEVKDKSVRVQANVYGESATWGLYNAIAALRNKTITVTTNYTSTGTKGTDYWYRYYGGGSVNGTANANGTAVAGGNWGIPKRTHALVGELGQELVVDGNNGTWHTVGDHGAEFVDLNKGDIVFNHRQTEDLLKHGRVTGRGKALLSGTALSSGSGGFIKRKNNGSNDYTSTSKSKTSSSSYKSSSTYNGNSSAAKAAKNAEDFSEDLDWIEVLLDRIERRIQSLARTAGSAFKSLTTRTGALGDEILTMADKIEYQAQAYNEYLDAANSLAISDEYKELVQSGKINLETITDKELNEKISKYKDLYTKALDARDAIDELHESMAQLYQDNFDNVQEEYNNQLKLYEHLTNTYQNGIEQLEQKGYLISTEYYTALSNVEKQNIAILNKQLDDMVDAMSEAMNSGEIEEYSSAWYSMQAEINGVKEAIDEANTSLLEYAKTMREVEWGYFDFVQDRISQLTQESNFLIDLLDRDELFDDGGKLTDAGMATLGLRGQNYNILMAQADQYRDEMLKVNKQLADDPYNTEILKRREELLKLQQESISAAEDERDAIIDLVHNGIDKQLDALKTLIDQYNDSLSSAKSLHDYQAKIEEQSKNIASLEKQLSAYSGDTSEEGRLNVQKLRSSLEDARSDLEETQYDRYISDQKQLLDDLYTDYELALNERFDNVDALLNDVIAVINAFAIDNGGGFVSVNEAMAVLGDNLAADLVGGDTSSIRNTLFTTADSVGYKLTQGMSDIWTKIAGENGPIAVMKAYGDGFTTSFTTINEVLRKIAEKMGAIKAQSDATAKAKVSSTTTTTAAKAPAKTTTTKTTTTKPAAAVTKNDQVTSDTIAKIAEAIWIYGSSATGWGTAPVRVGRINSKYPAGTGEKVQDYINAHYNELYAAWVKRGKPALSAYPTFNSPKYKSGGLIDFTGPAWVDGSSSNPESILSAADTKNFIDLRDSLRAISNRSQVSIPSALSAAMGKSAYTPIQGGDVSIGQLNIPIEHVENYNDFVAQLRKQMQSREFEKFIQSITIDRMNGGSSLSKYTYM